METEILELQSHLRSQIFLDFPRKKSKNTKTPIDMKTLEKLLKTKSKLKVGTQKACSTFCRTAAQAAGAGLVQTRTRAARVF